MTSVNTGREHACHFRHSLSRPELTAQCLLSNMPSCRWCSGCMTCCCYSNSYTATPDVGVSQWLILSYSGPTAVSCVQLLAVAARHNDQLALRDFHVPVRVIHLQLDFQPNHLIKVIIHLPGSCIHSSTSSSCISQIFFNLFHHKVPTL